ECDTDECAAGRIHGSFPQLVCIHLSKTLVALDFDAFAAVGAEHLNPFFKGVNRLLFPFFVDDVEKFSIRSDILVEREIVSGKAIFQVVEEALLVKLHERESSCSERFHLFSLLAFWDSRKRFQMALTLKFFVLFFDLDKFLFGKNEKGFIS